MFIHYDYKTGQFTLNLPEEYMNQEREIMNFIIEHYSYVSVSEDILLQMNENIKELLKIK